MSHAMFDRKWQSAMEQLSDLVYVENPDGTFDEAGVPIPNPNLSQPGASAPNIVTREVAFRHFAILYIRYVQVYKDLQLAYDQIVHPQKRRDIQIALDATMTRLLQVKNQLSGFNLTAPGSDYVNLNSLIEELKMTPYDLDIPTPLFFRELDPSSQAAQCRASLAAFTEQYGLSCCTEEVTSPIEITMPTMTLDDAIRIIQKNERGRQGLARGRMLKALASEQKKRRAVPIGEIDPVSAVLTLQRWFRGMLARIRARSENNRELKFLKMVPNNVSSHGIKLDPTSAIEHNETLRSVNDVHETRVQLRHDYELEYLDQVEQVKKTVEAVRGPQFREKMWIERYEWWIEQKEKLGVEHENFDEFYLMKNPPPAPENVDAEETQGDSKKGGKGKKEKDAKKGAKKDGKKGKKGDSESGGNDDALPYSVLIGPTPTIGDLYRCVKRYTDFWAKLDESKNFKQTADPDITAEKVTPEIVEKIRTNVDTELIAVLDNLKLQVQMRLQEENAKNGKKGKKGGKGKGGKAKSGKKGGKSKKGDAAAKPKKCCDGEKSLGDMSLSQCIDELVRLGIAQLLPENTKRIQDFVGDYNYLGSEYESAGISPDPSFAQIRSIVTESLVIPLGSPYVKQNSPTCNAALFYGPVGSGKSMLSKAVAWHTNSLWLDLSPKVLDKKLDGGTKQEVGRLIHMVFHVAKQAAPAVIYIDQIEQMFSAVSKKKSSANATKLESPGAEEILKIKKEFLAHRDGLTESDRVLIIGNTANPFGDNVDQSELVSFFKDKGKMIFTPFPDYGTRLRLWKTFIMKAGVNVYALTQTKTKFDLGTLVYVSHGYSAGSIQAAVQAVLPPRRVAKLDEKCKSAVTIDEFITALSKMPYTYKDHHKNFKDFTEDITGVKQRKALAAASAAAEEKAAGESKDSKKKKK